jgi:hypothetical protein
MGVFRRCEQERGLKPGGRIAPFEFENWTVIALGGIPNKTQVGDMGIDGRIYPVGATPR